MRFRPTFQSGCCRIAVELLSNCCRIAVELLSIWMRFRPTFQSGCCRIAGFLREVFTEQTIIDKDLFYDFILLLCPWKINIDEEQMQIIRNRCEDNYFFIKSVDNYFFIKSVDNYFFIKSVDNYFFIKSVDNYFFINCEVFN